MISSDLEKYINLCNERERLIDDNIILYNCTREEAISFVDYNLINEIDTFGKKISIELNKSQLKTENINGLNFIYGNDIERYFAVKFANENKELNKFIDKKIKIEVDKDVTNNSIIINELDDTIIIHTGVLNKFDVEKSMYISSKPELVEGYISEQYIPSLKNGLSSSFNSSLKDFYKNIPIIKDVINSLLNQFEDSIVDDLTVDVVSKKMSREEVISLALDFFKKVDKTGKLAEELLASINEGKVILFDNDEQKNEFVKNNYISMSENSSRVDPDSELIFIDSKYNSEDFVTLIHEFMHYNSVTNAKKNNSDMGTSYFREFASISFEYLARDFAK